MPDQAQLAVRGAQAGSLAYKVPNAQIVGLVCAAATYDGVAAGAAWLPAVVIVSDAGEVIATAITQATVAAGGAATVTFGPFLGPPGGGGGAGFDPNTALPFDGGELKVDAAIFPASDYWQTLPTAGGYVVVTPPALGDPSPDQWVVPVLRLIPTL